MHLQIGVGLTCLFQVFRFFFLFFSLSVPSSSFSIFVNFFLFQPYTTYEKHGTHPFTHPLPIPIAPIVPVGIGPLDNIDWPFLLTFIYSKVWFGSKFSCKLATSISKKYFSLQKSFLSQDKSHFLIF